MNKVAHYLQEHLVGEVMTGTEARRYFATDGSILTLAPSMIVYPQNENDVRKTARFTWQLAERGRVIPITARGSGTDQGGAAIGSGIMMVFPAHMHHLIDLDSKTGSIVVEPGINYGKLQQTLHSHGRFLPPFPASMEYSTIGGAIANNAGGEKSVKYGSTRDYVKQLKVVLANGEVIETRRLSKRELSKKLGVATFEGEVYRSLDTLIEENKQLISELGINTSKNSAGYDLAAVKRKDGSFDLTPLFVGSQGTLGIVTEAQLKTELYNQHTTLIAAQFDDLQVAEEVVLELRKMSESPSAIEAVDGNLLDVVQRQNPNLLQAIIRPPFPKLLLLIEFDDFNERQQKRLAKKVSKLLNKYQVKHQLETDPVKQTPLWKVRRSAAVVSASSDSAARAVPIIEDGIVPIDKLKAYIEGIEEIFARSHLQVALWGHAGDGNLHAQPFLDLSQVGDRQKAFRLLDEYNKLVIELGGSTTGEHGDGRIRGPYLEKLYGPEAYALFGKLKQIFDPYGTMNGGVKMGVSLEDVKPLVRQEYNLRHLSDHLPTS